MLSLTASSSMTLSQVQFVKNSVTELMSATVDRVKESTTSLLSQLPSSSSCLETNKFMNELDMLSNPFADVDTMYKLEKYVTGLPSYVLPVEHVLGQRWEGEIGKSNRI